MDEDEQASLIGCLVDSDTPRALEMRVDIVLETLRDGQSVIAVAKKLNTTPATVRKWRGRYQQQGILGLYDKPRPGAPRRISDGTVAQVINRSMSALPPKGHRWTIRSMIEASGLAHPTVQRIWERYGLTASQYATFSLCPDQPELLNVREIVALYVRPPLRVLVISCKATTGRMLRPGADAVRYRTLVAQLDDACMQHATACGAGFRVLWFRRFFDSIAYLAPRNLDLHIIVDGLTMQEFAAVHRQIISDHEDHCYLHATPTRAAWVDQTVWYWYCTKGQLSAGKLNQAMEGHLKTPGEPFVWKKEG